MAHTRENETLLALARGLHAQLEALERALEQKKGCAEVLHSLAAAHEAMNGLVAEAIQDYIRFHIVDPSPERNRTRAASAAGNLLPVAAQCRDIGPARNR